MAHDDRHVTDRPPVRRYAAFPRSWDALGLLLLGVFVVGWPVFVLVLIAAFAFTGCFIGCGDPSPGIGLLAALSALVVAAVPFGLVRLYQRGSAARRQVLVALTAAAAVAVLVTWVNTVR